MSPKGEMIGALTLGLVSRFRKKSKHLIIVSFLFIISFSVNAQTDTNSVSTSELDTVVSNTESEVKPDSSSKINDILISYGWLDYGLGSYTIDSKTRLIEHHLIYQPYLRKNSIVQIEFGLFHSQLDSNTFFSPGDLNISYQRNFKPKRVNDIGYQGSMGKMRLFIPTGRGEYYSGFDSWSIEPQLGFQWKVFNPTWILATLIRYNYSLASLPEKTRRYSFLQTEISFGIETKKYWLFIEPDYRYIHENQESNLFINFSGGYKLDNQIALKLNIKPRIYGSNFYESFIEIGLFSYL